MNYETLLNRITNFAILEKGWHFGEGKPADKLSSLNAKAVASLLHRSGISEFDAFPGLDGSVRVTGYKGDRYWEVTAKTNGQLDYIHEVAAATTNEEYGIDLSVLSEFVAPRFNFIRVKGWISSESYTPSTSIHISSGSSRKHSKLPATALESQSFRKVAERRSLAPYALISGSTTSDFQGLRRFIGTSASLRSTQGLEQPQA